MSAERLRPDQIERFQGHLSLPEFGLEGQRRLAGSRALLVGVGGLGCPAAQYLVAAGVGALTLVDHDEVDRTNLQRQVLFGPEDVGRPKAEVAAGRLSRLNPDVELRARIERVGADNARSLVADHDLVIDGSDNFPTRYVLNDACVLEGVPLVSGSLYRYEGQLTVVDSPRTGCYRCAFREPPGDGSPCRDTGVLGPLAGLIGAWQAAEAVQILARPGSSELAGRLLLVDARGATVRSVALERDPACPVCGDSPTIREPTSLTGCGAARG